MSMQRMMVLLSYMSDISRTHYCRFFLFENAQETRAPRNPLRSLHRAGLVLGDEIERGGSVIYVRTCKHFRTAESCTNTRRPSPPSSLACSPGQISVAFSRAFAASQNFTTESPATSDTSISTGNLLQLCGESGHPLPSRWSYSSLWCSWRE